MADGLTTSSGSYKTPPAFRFTEGGQSAPTEILAFPKGKDFLPGPDQLVAVTTPPMAPPATQRLATPNWLPIFSKVVETLSMDQSLEETLDTILGLAFEAIAPERAYLLLRDEHGQLQLQAHRTTQQTAHLEVMLPWSIHAHVLQDGKPILVSHARHEGPHGADTPAASLIAAPAGRKRSAGHAVYGQPLHASLLWPECPRPADHDCPCGRHQNRKHPSA